jgi:hypothetical protein
MAEYFIDKVGNTTDVTDQPTMTAVEEKTSHENGSATVDRETAAVATQSSAPQTTPAGSIGGPVQDRSVDHAQVSAPPSPSFAPSTPLLPGSRVYVQTSGVNDALLRELFAAYGPLLEVKPISGEAGFVQLTTPSQASAAVQTLHQTVRNGHPLTVEIARDMTKPMGHHHATGTMQTTSGGYHAKADKPCFKCGQLGHWQS